MNKNPFLLPISIVIAGAIIAGAILYTPGEKSSATKDSLFYVNLAGTLGLDTKVFKACIDSHVYRDEVLKDQADGSAVGVDGTPSTFINGRKIEGAAPFAEYEKAIKDAMNDTKPLSDVNLDEIKPSADDDAVLGRAGAPITMVVFGDYQCPFCQQSYLTAEKEVRDTYVASGEVRIVFRDYPLSFHPAAGPAAEASECAHAQGKFWEYHDALFENQKRLPIPLN